MKSIVRLSLKALTNQITLKEFEEEIYSEFYLDRINQEDIIYDIVTIDYKSDAWKKQLNEIVKKHLTEEQSVLLHVYFLIFQIIQFSSKETESIFNVIEQLATLCLETDFEYEMLNEFYSINEEIGLIDIGYARDSEFIIIEIKNLAREFLNKYDMGLTFEELMTLDSDLISNYKPSKIMEDSVDFPLDLKSEKSFILEFIKQRILNLESKKGTIKKLKDLGYSEESINESYGLATTNVIPSLKNRILIYSIIGLPTFYVGVMSILKEDTLIFLIGFLLIGFGLLLTSFLYLIKLIAYLHQIKRKNL